MWECRDTEVRGCGGAGVRECRGAGVRECRGKGVQEFGSAEVWGCGGPYGSAGMPVCGMD